MFLFLFILFMYLSTFTDIHYTLKVGLTRLVEVFLLIVQQKVIYIYIYIIYMYYIYMYIYIYI